MNPLLFVNESLHVSALVLVLSIAPCAAFGQTKADSLRELQNAYSVISAQIRDALFVGLTPDERAIYSEIEFRITLDDNPSPNRARAYQQHGQRIIETSVGYVRALDMIVDATIIGDRTGNPAGFVGDYVRYVLERWRINWDRTSRGLPPLKIAAPYEFGHLSASDIDRLENDQTRNGAFGNALGFVLGHEVGHHVLGHTDRRYSDKKESRHREEAADAWSIRLMLRNGANPIPGMFALMFDYLASDDDSRLESTSTHPTNIFRIRAMCSETKADKRAVAKLASSIGVSVAEMNRRIDAILAGIEAALKTQ